MSTHVLECDSAMATYFAELYTALYRAELEELKVILRADGDSDINDRDTADSSEEAYIDEDCTSTACRAEDSEEDDDDDDDDDGCHDTGDSGTGNNDGTEEDKEVTGYASEGGKIEMVVRRWGSLHKVAYLLWERRVVLQNCAVVRCLIHQTAMRVHVRCHWMVIELRTLQLWLPLKVARLHVRCHWMVMVVQVLRRGIPCQVLRLHVQIHVAVRIQLLD